ncbi:AzlC family ABC transporter permease [Nitratifractor sp.]|uniref:AzlC family ABC transporter permease n=1 Tax=Nitratifractor sp. TaxID=2268144 RepID=UPI0025EE206F|nr:AzlC family ABC transporter permease [Nitratifractor sp.]
MRYADEFRAAFKASIPVMMGYSVLGFAFGLLMTSQGYPWILPVVMSLVIYAGALQFLALGFFQAKAGMGEIFVASIFVNIRQAFYGLSLLKKFKKAGRLRPYLIFALTDETYALMTTLPEDSQLKRRWYLFFLAALNQSYWVGGTLAGALFGGMVRFDTRGLDFSLTALFVVLAMEQYKRRRDLLPFFIGAGASLIALVLVSKDRMLITAIGLALLGMFALREKLEKGEKSHE